MTMEDKIKLFGMSHALVERDLDNVEERLGINLFRSQSDDKDEDYYPQFDQVIRSEASEMGRHYEIFYCLEKGIRKIIAETLKNAHGDNWWGKCAPDLVKKNVEENMKREAESGFTARSTYEIDYTSFGELGDIVRNNWIDFDSLFSSQKAFSKIMTSLNMLRGPIAHCSPLAADEVVRLQLTLKDWFRLME